MKSFRLRVQYNVYLVILRMPLRLEGSRFIKSTKLTRSDNFIRLVVFYTVRL